MGSKEIVIARKTWREIISKKENRWIIILLNILLLTTTILNYYATNNHNQQVAKLSKEVREKWVGNPDKHPHRMSHYGYIVFRAKYPLSFFDKGLDSSLGNSAFLEAHKQNTVNFSEQSFSHNLLAFGEISAGMILQILLTLLIFFWGYGMVSKERETGMLKTLLMQGVNWKNIIFGKSIGLFALSLTVSIPVFILCLALLPFESNMYEVNDTLARYITLFASYQLYFLTLSLFTSFVSAVTSTSKLSIGILVGYWLLFVIIFPKISAVIGKNIYPSPSKVEFDIQVEREMLKHGDSHNPDDPYFNNLKDSLLTAYNVKSTKQLPFNYSGYVMKKSEKLSADIYNQHKKQLVNTFIKQQDFVKWAAILNPYMAIKNISVAVSGTDYLEYLNFENMAEEFRYYLAQFLNNLQIKHISNVVKSSSDKNAALDSSYWKTMKDFDHKFTPINKIFLYEFISFTSLIFWFIGIGIIIITYEKKYKALK